MNIDEIINMWAADAEVDDTRLDVGAIDTAKLHAKYLNLLIDAKLKLIKYKGDHSQLRRDKFRYFRGEMTREELNERGWDQWQYAKPLKAEMEEFLQGDADFVRSIARVGYIETMVSTLESIMSQIKSRDFQIKNAIQWKMFMSGS